MVTYAQGIADAVEICYDEKAEGHNVTSALLEVIRQRLPKIDFNEEYIEGFIAGLHHFLRKKIIQK
jgi:hypothetical protein